MACKMLLRSHGRRSLSTAAAQGSRILVWGNGNSGQLGLGPLKMEGIIKSYDELVPKEVKFPLNEGETVVDVSGGQDHSLAVTSTGRVFGWGSGKDNKLALKDDKVLTPTLVTALAGVKAASVSCGESHSCVVDSQGRLWTWGFGGSWFSGGGLLGHGSNDSEPKPKLVESLVAEKVVVKSATAGELHTAVLTSDGEVMTCGAGEYGRLGHGGSSDYQTFAPIDYINEEAVKQLVSGHAFSLALTTGGRVYGWGRNDQGQLGQGGTMSLDVYSMASDPLTIDEFESMRRGGQESVQSLAAGHSHAALVTSTGDLWMWGMKTYLSPKKFDCPEPIRAVSCGYNFTVAIGKNSGDVYTFGNGGSSCLGHGDKKFKPQLTVVEALKGKGVTRVVCGHRHAFAFAK